MILCGVVFVVVSVVISGSRGEAVLDPRSLLIAGFLVAVGLLVMKKWLLGTVLYIAFFGVLACKSIATAWTTGWSLSLLQLPFGLAIVLIPAWFQIRFHLARQGAGHRGDKR